MATTVPAGPTTGPTYFQNALEAIGNTPLVKLNKDLNLTIVLSEHRLERVVQHADRILYMDADGSSPCGPVMPPGPLNSGWLAMRCAYSRRIRSQGLGQ